VAIVEQGGLMPMQLPWAFVAGLERVWGWLTEHPDRAALWAALVAIATTPLAVAILARTPWFQARRGRTLQRPSFPAVVVATLLIMGIPAIFAALVIKSADFDRNRYEFDPNRVSSVLGQGRQFEARDLYESVKAADKAVAAERDRLAAQRKALVDTVKKLDQAMLGLGEASVLNAGTSEALPPVIDTLADVRQAAGVGEAPERWKELVVLATDPDRLEMLRLQARPTVVAAPGAAPSPPSAPALTLGPFEGERASVTAPQKTLALLLPLAEPPAGWEVGDLGGRHLETFQPANMHEKINGRAESFLQYNVNGMAYANFHPKGDDSDEIQLYAFEFPRPLDAFGKYGAEKPAGATTVPVGTEGYGAAGSVSFHQGKYFVQVVSTSKEPEFAEAAMALARAVSGRIERLNAPAGQPSAAPSAVAAETPEPSAEPAELDPAAVLRLLPDGPGRGSSQYVAQDVFGYSFLSDVFLADFKDGEATWQGFLRPCESPEAARALLEEYVAAVKTDGGEVEEIQADGVGKMIAASNIGLFDVVFAKGNALAGANGATERASAEAFARQLARDLPEKVPFAATAGAGAKPGPAGD
jgi:hypothetical protein